MSLMASLYAAENRPSNRADLIDKRMDLVEELNRQRQVKHLNAVDDLRLIAYCAGNGNVQVSTNGGDSFKEYERPKEAFNSISCKYSKGKDEVHFKLENGSEKVLVIEGE